MLGFKLAVLPPNQQEVIYQMKPVTMRNELDQSHG